MIIHNKGCIVLADVEQSHPGKSYGDCEFSRLMIDTRTGVLFVRSFTVDLPMHGTADDNDIPWEELSKLVIRLEPDEAKKICGLNKENWHDWLLGKGLLT